MGMEFSRKGGRRVIKRPPLVEKGPLEKWEVEQKLMELINTLTLNEKRMLLVVLRGIVDAEMAKVIADGWIASARRK